MCDDSLGFEDCRFATHLLNCPDLVVICPLFAIPYSLSRSKRPAINPLPPRVCFVRQRGTDGTEPSPSSRSDAIASSRYTQSRREGRRMETLFFVSPSYRRKGTTLPSLGKLGKFRYKPCELTSSLDSPGSTKM